jgi:hypothetical protein
MIPEMEADDMLVGLTINSSVTESVSFSGTGEV